MVTFNSQKQFLAKIQREKKNCCDLPKQVVFYDARNAIRRLNVESRLLHRN